MKKILSVFAMMAMLFAACTPEDQPGTNEGGNENEGGNNNGGNENTEQKAPELKLTTAATLDFTAEGGDGSISYVISDPVQGASVSATCDADWITDLKAGETRATFTVAPYESTEAPRSTKIVLTYDKAPAVEVNVTQQPAAAEVKPDAPDVEFTATYLFGEYAGTAYGTEGYNYYVILTDMIFELTQQGMAFNTGSHAYILDLYSEVAVGDGENIIPNGTYELDMTSAGDPGTIAEEFSSYVEVGDDLSQYDYTSATLTVTDNKLELVAVVGGKTHKVTYEGSLLLTMPGQGGNTGGSVSTLTGDVEVEHNECVIMAANWGDFYEIGLDNYMFEVYTNAETGVGDYFIFETLTSADTFAGNYTFLTDATEVFDNLVMPASMDEDYNLLGSWYLSLSWNEEYEGPAIDGVTVAPLFDGEMVFEFDEEAGTCTILLDGYDDAGNNVVASLSGIYMLEDYSEEEAAYVKKNRASSKSNGLKNIKSLKTPSKSNTFVIAR